MAAASLLNLKRARPCKLGGHINVRTEKHGEENVPACDVTLAGVLLEQDELDTLLGDGTHKALFITKRDELSEPRFKDFKPFALKHKFEKSRVAIEIDGVDDELVFDDIKISRVRVAPQVGGLTAVDVSVQCTPSSDIIALLYDHMDVEVRAKIRFGRVSEKTNDKQDELALTNGSTEPKDDEAAE